MCGAEHKNTGPRHCTAGLSVSNVELSQCLVCPMCNDCPDVLGRALGARQRRWPFWETAAMIISRSL
eukprot:4800445-Amphidinium_carterae.1